MQSVEKKQIIQNGIFGTAAGLVMGGPLGALFAATTAIGLGKLQEKEDEIKRQHYIDIRETNYQEIEKRIRSNTEYFKEQCDLEKIIECYLKIEREDKLVLRDVDGVKKYVLNPDFLFYETHVLKRTDCHITNNHKKNIIRGGIVIPNINPHVIVYISKKIRIENDNIQFEIEGEGMIYDVIRFAEKMKKDIDNPNFEWYNVGLTIPNSLYCGWIKYMYTTDKGNHFVICGRSSDICTKGI